MTVGVLDDFRTASEDAAEFYPGSRKAIIRHPNRAQSTPAPIDPDAWDHKPKILKMAGVDTEFFTVGQLSQALGRRPGTIRGWERNKIIPKATVRYPSKDPRGVRRLYTREQVEGLLRIATEEGLMNEDNRSITATNFTERAFQLFRQLAAA